VKSSGPVSFEVAVGSGICGWLRWVLTAMKTTITKSHAYGNNLRLRMSSASGFLDLLQNTYALQNRGSSGLLPGLSRNLNNARRIADIRGTPENRC
jgi:hypothetical protein